MRAVRGVHAQPYAAVRLGVHLYAGVCSWRCVGRDGSSVMPQSYLQKLGSILAQEQWKHEKEVEPIGHHCSPVMMV